jgi:hypothetical protein
LPKYYDLQIKIIFTAALGYKVTTPTGKSYFLSKSLELLVAKNKNLTSQYYFNTS